jgi:hypothetical protein
MWEKDSGEAGKRGSRDAGQHDECHPEPKAKGAEAPFMTRSTHVLDATGVLPLRCAQGDMLLLPRLPASPLTR